MAIHANISLRDKPKFDALLHINKTYRISGFGTCTDIRDTPDTGFPCHYFNFASYRDLYSKIDVKEGMLTGT